MPIFPRIQSPCPYKSDLAAVMDGDMCRMCNRQVFSLDAMSDGDRVAFLAGCKEEVCVSFRLPIGPAIAAAALAAAAVPSAAMAEDTDSMLIVVGGIKDPAHVKLTENVADAAIPDLPVVYEGGRKAPAQAAAKGQPGKTPVRRPARI